MGYFRGLFFEVVCLNFNLYQCFGLLRCKNGVLSRTFYIIDYALSNKNGVLSCRFSDYIGTLYSFRIKAI